MPKKIGEKKKRLKLWTKEKVSPLMKMIIKEYCEEL